MAFMGIVLIFLAVIVMVLFFGIGSYVGGTILYHKTSHKKLGLALRIVGYLFIVPLIVISAFFVVFF